jgi:hypothetical protein
MFWPSIFLFSENYFIIWVLLIVFCKIDSIWCSSCRFSNVLNYNQNLKLDWMNFYSKFLDIHKGKKTNLPWLLWFKMVIKKVWFWLIMSNIRHFFWLLVTCFDPSQFRNLEISLIFVPHLFNNKYITISSFKEKPFIILKRRRFYEWASHYFFNFLLFGNVS